MWLKLDPAEEPQMGTDEHGFTAATAAVDTSWLGHNSVAGFSPTNRAEQGFVSVFISVNPWFEMNGYGLVISNQFNVTNSTAAPRRLFRLKSQ